MRLVIFLLLAYFIGSIPTGYLFVKKFLGIDIREYGSGNVGATNVARKLGFKMGAAVALIDIMKGFIPVIAARLFLGLEPAYLLYLIGFAAIIGHDWSIFLGFDGGKGVATTFGVILAAAPLSFVVLGLIWLAITFSIRIVSLASLLGTLTLPFTVYLFSGDPAQAAMALILFVFVVYTHRENINRLIKGEEKRIKPGSEK